MAPAVKIALQLHNSLLALLAAIQATMLRTRTQDLTAPLWAMPRTRTQALPIATPDVPVLTGTERPPLDAYDKYVDLVPPQLYATPALTNVDKVYTKYGNAYQKEKWRPLSIEAKAYAQRLYRKWNLSYNIRFKCGLYIIGSETDMQDEQRDRMMVLVFELNETQLSCWNLLHPDAMRLLDKLGLSGQPGVCIRYYHRVERTSTNRPGESIIQGSHNTSPLGQGSNDFPPGDSIEMQALLVPQSPEEYEESRRMRRLQRELQRRADAVPGPTAQPVTMSQASYELSSMIRFEELEARSQSYLLQPPVRYTARYSADNPRPTWYSLPELNAYHQRTSHDSGSGISGDMNPYDVLDSASWLLEENEADLYDPEGTTDVSLSDESVMASDDEEESLLPRVPEPAFEFR